MSLNKLYKNKADVLVRLMTAEEKNKRHFSSKVLNKNYICKIIHKEEREIPALCF